VVTVVAHPGHLGAPVLPGGFDLPESVDVAGVLDDDGRLDALAERSPPPTAPPRRATYRTSTTAGLDRGAGAVTAITRASHQVTVRPLDSVPRVHPQDPRERSGLL